MKLVMMKGLPASGKSTQAQKMIEGGGEFFRVNRDCLREMLHFNKWTGKREGVTIDAAQMLVGNLLSQGMNVIIDDTNLGEKHEQMWRTMADNFGAKFEVLDMMDGLTVEECLARNAERGHTVPDSVIKNMAVQYGYAGLKKIVVVDIDGTVADCTHRQHYVHNVQPKNWKAFFAEMDKDTPRKDVYKQAVDLAIEKDAQIVFVSARPEDYREVTEQWLRDNKMDDYNYLLMRRKGDKRPDTDVKFDIYNRSLKQYKIIRVFDDRPAVIRMWREQGLEVEDVGNGEEF